MTHYPYLDLSVLEKVRALVISPRAALIINHDLSELYWANSEGLKFLGIDRIGDLSSASVSLKGIVRRQISSAIAQLEDDDEVGAAMRISSGWKSRLVNFSVSGIDLPDGNKAVLLVTDSLQGLAFSQKDMAAMTVASLTGVKTLSAVLDGDGGLISASDNFSDYDVDLATRTTLIDEVANENDRLVKRLVETGNRTLAAGIARLCDDPPLHLLILADEVETTAAESEDTQVQSSENSDGEIADDGNIEPEQQPLDEPSKSGEPRFSQFSSRRPSLTAGDGGVELQRWYYRQPKTEPVEETPDETENVDVIDTEDVTVSDDATPDVSDRVSAEADHDIQEAEPGDVDRDVIDINNTKTVPPMDLSLFTASIAAADKRDKAAAERVEAEIKGDTGEGFEFVSTSRPTRFAWRMDADYRFTTVSPELADTVGALAANIIGNKWKDIARTFSFDSDGSINERLQRGDTWSGKSVLWPVQATDLRVPVDLAGLPSFDQKREFTGYHGFGTIRTADAVVDPEETGLALVGKASLDEADDSISARAQINPFTDETAETETAEQPKVPEIEPVETSGTVVNLTEQRQARNNRELSDGERTAFKEIAEKLSDDSEKGVQPEKTAEIPTDSKVETDNVSDLTPVDTPDTDPLENEAVSTEETGDEPDGEQAYLPSAFAVSGGDYAPDPDTSILAALPIAVVIFKDNQPLFGNQEFAELTGFENIQDLEDQGGIEALLGAPDGEHDGYTRINSKDGDQLSVKAHLQSVPWSGSRALLLAFREDRDQAKTDAATAATLLDSNDAGNTLPSQFANISSSELSGILDTATDGVVVLSGSGEILSINRAAEALFGYEADAVIGKNITELLARESHRSARDYLSGLAGTGVASLLNDGRELIGRESQGGLIPLFVTMGKLEESDRYCAVMRDITQWKKAEEDLVAARRQAELASDQKTDFLAKISHEIRTPLNAIIGFSDIMLEERFGKIGIDRYREYLRDINRSGSHVLELVNDLLDISKIEAGKLELDFSEVKLNDIIAEGVALTQPQANRDQIIIRTSLSGAVPPVVADPRSIRQIILNLVSNAIKYTKAGGQVIVSTVFEETGEVVLRIRDTGIGMSESEIATALMPFRRVQTISHQQGEGTGLGLPLTKALVEANRAQFSIESTPGEGTLVEIYFPSTRVLTE